jgi:hypothetical protein
MSGSLQTFPLSTIFPIDPATNPVTYSCTMTAHIRPVDLRRLLVGLPALGLRVGTQPQCDVLRLHRLLHHPPRTAPQATRQARLLAGPTYQLLDPGPLLLLSAHIQSTRRPSPRRYDKRYEQDLLESFLAKSQTTSSRTFCLANSPVDRGDCGRICFPD